MRRRPATPADLSTEDIHDGDHPSNAAAVEQEIQRFLDSIPWESGGQIRASKFSRATGWSLESIHRSRLKGNSITRPDGSTRRTYLAMMRVFGEFTISRAALEMFLRENNGLVEPTETDVPSAPRRRSIAERNRSSRAADVLCESMNS